MSSHISEFVMFMAFALAWLAYGAWLFKSAARARATGRARQGFWFVERAQNPLIFKGVIIILMASAIIISCVGAGLAVSSVIYLVNPAA